MIAMDAVQNLDVTLRLMPVPQLCVLAIEGDIESLLGFSPGSFKDGSVSLAELIHSDDRDIVDAMLTCQPGNQLQICNLRLRQANRRIRCLHAEYAMAHFQTEAEATLSLRLQDAKSLFKDPDALMSSASFRTMMEKTNDFIFFKDRNHVFTGASQTLVNVTDPASHWTDLIGQTDYDVFPEVYADLYYRLEKQVFAGIPVAQEIQEFQTNDGMKGWVDNRKYPIKNEQGEITGLFGVARVITDQVLAEQALLMERDSSHNILSTVEAMIVALDINGRITLINRKSCQILGYRDDELLGKDWFTACLPRSIDVDQDREAFKRSLSGKLALAEYHESLVLTRAGDERLIAWHNSAIRDKEGRVIGGLSAGEDITERKKNEEKLLESQQLLDAVINEIPDPIVLKDHNGDFLLCNRAVAQLYNTTPEAMLGKNDGDFGVPKEMSDFFRSNVIEIMAKGAAEIVYEESVDRATGEVHHYRSIKKPFKSALGHDQILVIAQDITDVIQAQAKVADSERLLQEVLAITDEGIWDWHIPSGKVIHNPQWYKLLKAAPGEIAETFDAFANLLHPDDSQAVQKRFSALLDGLSDNYTSKHRLLRKDGSQIWVLDRGRVVEKDPLGHPVRVIGSFTDITYQVEHQRQLELIAHYDILTGLPNRLLLADRMRLSMAHCKRSGEMLAVCIMDLDGFKPVNDSLGHQAGDAVLQEIARRLLDAIRAGDTVARIGGDEFALLLGGFKIAETCELALHRLLDSVAQPFSYVGQPIRVSGSLGVTFYQGDKTDADKLLRHADQAMYVAKEKGKNRFHVFDTAVELRLRANQGLYKRIEKALEKGQFSLFYQPKVDCRNGRIAGMEALIRWNHPTLGIRGPAEFIPIIEHDDLIIRLGEWVIAEALRQMEAWRQAGLDLAVSVNVTVRQFVHGSFNERMLAMLSAYPPEMAGRLELELVETAALEDINAVSRVMAQQHSYGIHFALDDFGTGYSSLVHLKRLAVDVLKVDQTFVRDMLDDPGDLAIVQGVIGLASAFHHQVVAEGVETTEQILMLLDLGCDLMQGYGLSRPMPAEKVLAWVREFQPDPRWRLDSKHFPSRSDFDLLLMEVAHRHWLERWLDKPLAQTDLEALTLEECGFQKWSQGSGLRRYGDHPEFLEINQAYRQVHRRAESLMSAYRSGDTGAIQSAKLALVEASTALIDRMHKLRLSLANWPARKLLPSYKETAT